MSGSHFGILTVHSWGHTTEGGRKQLAIRMSPELFARLKARAIKEEKSMQKKLVEYLEVGLIVDDDWDEDEPSRHDVHK